MFKPAGLSPSSRHAATQVTLGVRPALWRSATLPRHLPPRQRSPSATPSAAAFASSMGRQSGASSTNIPAADRWWRSLHAEWSTRSSTGWPRDGSGTSGVPAGGSSASSTTPGWRPPSLKPRIAPPPALTSSGAGTSGSTMAWPRGRLGPATPELSASVHPLAKLCGSDPAAVARAVACLPPGPMQQRIVQHGCQVARFLASLGCSRTLRAQLLRRCLLLFSCPPEERAAPLLAQLAATGLLPAEAARCLERCPMAAVTPSFLPALKALAGLLAQAGPTGGSSSSRRGSRQRLQAVGKLLRAQPEAAALLTLCPAEIDQRAAHLCTLGLGPAALALALRHDALLLALTPEEVDERAEAVGEELGGGPAFLAALLAAGPSVLAQCEAGEELAPHAAALAEHFGQEAARSMVLSAPQLLALPTPTWRTSLATLALCWVPDACALAQRNPHLLCADLASVRCTAARLVLQRALGLTAAQVYQQLGGCCFSGGVPLETLAGRLHLLQQRGLGSASASTSREGSGSPGSAAAAPATAGQAAFPGFTVQDVCTLPVAQLAQRLRLPVEGLLTAQAEFSGSPAWRFLLTAAEAEAARLQRLVQLEEQEGGGRLLPTGVDAHF